MFFHFVFSAAARLIKLPSVTEPGEILSSPIELKSKETRYLIQLENGPNEFYFYFYFVLQP